MVGRISKFITRIEKTTDCTTTALSSIFYDGVDVFVLQHKKKTLTVARLIALVRMKGDVPVGIRPVARGDFKKNYSKTFLS